MADYDRFKLGTVEYPLPSTLIGPSKTICNPGIAAALDYYAAMLQRYVGPYWDAVCASIGMSDYVGKVVAEKVPYDPYPYGVDGNRKFPMLCLFRSTEEMREHTRAWYMVDSIWQLYWILPTVSAAQYLHMSQLMVAARSTILDRTETGHDPTYNNDDWVWATAFGDGFTIQVVNAEYMHWVPPGEGEKTNLLFPVLKMEIKVSEREQKTPGLDNFVTFDTEISVKDDAGETIVVQTTQDMT